VGFGDRRSVAVIEGEEVPLFLVKGERLRLPCQARDIWGQWLRDLDNVAFCCIPQVDKGDV